MRLSLAALLLVAAAAGSARAGDPTLEWRTLESAHFVIHYYEPNEDLARRVAAVAERSYEILTPALGHVPSEKTQVVITDDTDGANGFASVIPRNAIHLFATAPSSISVLNDHDDWLYGLFAHEYTHVLHLDTIGGLPRLYNKIFGKTWAPNQIQPRWFVEGLATYEESLRSSSGRTRNSIFDMYLRVAVLNGVRLDLDAVSSGPYYWPHGNAAYLYGSYFLKFIADRHGDDKMKKISKEYGWQPVPFGLNRAIRRKVGKDYVQLWQEWTDHLARRYALQRQAVERRGVIEGEKLTDTGEGNNAARFTPDGTRLAWQRSDGKSRQQYRIAPATAAPGENEQLVSIDGAGGFDWLPDGSGLILEITRVYRNFYDFGDLFHYDLSTKKLTRLTTAARIADPDVSPDGKQVAVTVNGRSSMRLALIRLDEEPARATVIWQGKGRWDQAFTPRWSPDGARLVFSAWTTGGYRDLYLYDLAAASVARLTEDRAIDADPTFTPDGEWIVFSSDRSGIYNLYALRVASGELRQVTNVLGGAFQPEISPDGKTLVYQGYDQDGFELFRLPLDPAAWLAPDPYLSDRPAHVDIPDGDVVIDEPRPYRPLETLLPRQWQIALGNDAFGNAVTVSTFGNDIVGLHSWAIGATYGFERSDVTFGASYAYDRFWPSLRASAGRGLGRPGGLVVDTENTRYTEEVWSANATIGLPVLREPSIASDLTLTYDFDWLRRVEPVPVPTPDMAVPRPPETGFVAGVILGWNLSNLRRYVYSLGPAEGRTAGLSLRLDHPALGSDFRRAELSWRLQQYWQMPWKRDHIFGVRYSGAIEQTDRRRDGEFSLGGLPSQDIFESIVNSTRVGITYLRGYEPGVVRGRQFHLANFEYRAPLLVIEEGVQTMPVYVRKLHAAALVDWGNAFNGAFDPTEFKLGVGASLRLDVVFGWFAPGTFDLGYARGLSEGGINQWWFLLTGTL